MTNMNYFIGKIAKYQADIRRLEKQNSQRTRTRWNDENITEEKLGATEE